MKIKTITNKQARLARLDIIGSKIVENLSSKWGPNHILTYLLDNYYLLFIILTGSNNQFRIWIFTRFFWQNRLFKDNFWKFGIRFSKEMSWLFTYFKNVRVTFYEQKARKNKKALTWKKRDYDWLQKNAIAMLLWIQSKETSF